MDGSMSSWTKPMQPQGEQANSIKIRWFEPWASLLGNDCKPMQHLAAQFECLTSSSNKAEAAAHLSTNNYKHYVPSEWLQTYFKNNTCHIVSLENPISIRTRKPHSGSATTLLLLEQPNTLHCFKEGYMCVSWGCWSYPAYIRQRICIQCIALRCTFIKMWSNLTFMNILPCQPWIECK